MFTKYLLKKFILYNKNLKKNIFTNINMANSKYDYVKKFETEDKIIPNCWIVIRIDGKAFHKFCKLHDFDKPNDESGLNLMNHAAINVMKEYHDIILGYGQSDEYSFIFHKSTELYNRRSAKLMSNINSLFATSYVFHWNEWFPTKTLQYPPSFDARVIIYPSDENLKDYLSWRQADVHINNLYNTAFWNLVLNGGRTNSEAELELRGTFSADKNEILFSKFGINYNNLSIMYRKGTTLLRKKINLPTINKDRQIIVPLYVDMIQEKFWNDNHELLDKKSPQKYDLNKQELSSQLILIQIANKEKNNA